MHISPGPHECGESGRAIGRVQAFSSVAFKVQQVYDSVCRCERPAGDKRDEVRQKNKTELVPAVASELRYKSTRLNPVLFAFSVGAVKNAHSTTTACLW